MSGLRLSAFFFPKLLSRFRKMPCWVTAERGWYQGEPICCNAHGQWGFVKLFSWIEEKLKEERQGTSVLVNPVFAQRSKSGPPPWFVGYTRQVETTMQSLDRMRQERILEALLELGKDPEDARGNTVERLTGDQCGFWRYRIDDYLLIYQADRSTGNVLVTDLKPGDENDS